MNGRWSQLCAYMSRSSQPPSLPALALPDLPLSAALRAAMAAFMRDFLTDFAEELVSVFARRRFWFLRLALPSCCGVLAFFLGCFPFAWAAFFGVPSASSLESSTALPSSSSSSSISSSSSMPSPSSSSTSSSSSSSFSSSLIRSNCFCGRREKSWDGTARRFEVFFFLLPWLPSSSSSSSSESSSALFARLTLAAASAASSSSSSLPSSCPSLFGGGTK
mmetsp:Transcript_10667/g.20996  ORF Transcript_10667/g.20996 Transcript_10667/m.20996 type:complete len:220 (-) Transcript_10667:1609-2268(-)